MPKLTVMTTILALDTSTTACSVALSADGQVDEDFAVAPQDHTKRLLPMVDRLLSRHQLSLRDLDAIAFTQGPGSFTGLRICVGIVQGLAFGAGLPVIPVSTLETMAATAQRSLGLEPRTLLVPALDARMAEVYWGLYAASPAHERPECLVADGVNSPHDLIAALKGQAIDAQEVHVFGSASPLLDQAELAALGVQTHPEVYPHAQDLARIAERLLRVGETQSALEARPAYVRNEVSWVKRQRIRQ